MGKLLPRSCFPVLRNAAPPPPPPLLVEDKGKEDGLTADRTDAVARRSSSANQASVDKGNVPSAAAEDGTHAPAGPEPGSPATAGKLFVFREPPQSRDLAEPPRRKTKKNFLNLKKNTVAPTDLP